MKHKMMKSMCALMLGAVMLGGCSGADSGNSSGTEADLREFPKLEDTRPEEYKENTFTTLNGDEVTYNMNTRKIVCLFGSQDVVAFGIPLLAYEGSTDITGYESFYDGASALMNSTPFSPEEVLSYEPELILVNQKMSASNIEALSKIAPVIPLYTDSTDFKTRLSYIGEIFGLQEHAKKLIAYADTIREEMVSELKKLGLSDKTLTIYTYMGAISIPPERGWFMNTILFDYAGIKRLPQVEAFMKDESGVAYEAISAEKLKDYEGDMVIYAGFGEKTVSTYVSENVGWQALNAVREDRVGVIDITPYAQKGVILLENQYGQIMEALKKAGQVK
ncbi:MAG: ABC transporter substrate-binding protein [Solobacterium sp.]|nr:ABC transporter substrate-binding protein [Solobacterium sp.]